MPPAAAFRAALLASLPLPFRAHPRAKAALRSRPAKAAFRSRPARASNGPTTTKAAFRSRPARASNGPTTTKAAFRSRPTRAGIGPTARNPRAAAATPNPRHRLSFFASGPLLPARPLSLPPRLCAGPQLRQRPSTQPRFIPKAAPFRLRLFLRRWTYSRSYNIRIMKL
jgi:hypothetical protein